MGTIVIITVLVVLLAVATYRSFILARELVLVIRALDESHQLYLELLKVKLGEIYADPKTQRFGDNSTNRKLS